MRSPICYLVDNIYMSPINIAPEKKDCLKKKFKDFNIKFLMLDEPKFGIRVRLNADSQAHEIILPIASLEYLWAFSHYFWVFTQEYTTAQRNGKTTFDPIGNKRLKESHSILQWAKENLLKTGTESWPKDGPRPEKNSQVGDDTMVATELFLCAIAWIIHHEISHVVLKHPLLNTAFSEQEERAADKHATDWLLDSLSQDDAKLKKRVLGITVAVLCIQSLEVNTTSCLHNTHPAAYDRIFQNSFAYIVEKDEIVEAMCTIMLQYLFNGSSVNVKLDERKEEETFISILGDILKEISRSSGDNR